MQLSNLQLFQFTDKYARWNDELQRRETWYESVYRAVQFLREISHNKLSNEIYGEIYQYIAEMKVAPSMRLMAMAGEPARRNNIALYNCAFLNLDSIDSFVELMVVLLEGAGCGYSVESKVVYKLPIVKKLTGETAYHTVQDTSEGWYEAFRLLLNNLYNGIETKFDYTLIRPAGTRLKTKGGTASGAEPLKRLFNFCNKTFKNAQGRKLTTLECHDIACYVGDAIVSGGVRRSALIALFDENDEDMLNCKSLESEWWKHNLQRSRANNSIVINEWKNKQWFIDYVNQMDDSKAGEPGLFSQYAIKHTLPDRRNNNTDYYTNPCRKSSSTVLTPNGIISTIGKTQVGDIIWSKEGWTTVVNKVMTGIKPVYRYSTTANEVDATENHPIISYGEMVEIGQAESLDIITGEYRFDANRSRNLQAVVDGLVLGDGSIDASNQSPVMLTIGENDHSYFEDEIAPYIGNKRAEYVYYVKTTLDNSIGYTYNRQVPESYLMADYYTKADFLRGLYTANGSVVGKGQRVTLKSSSYRLVKQVQLMLNSLGIRSYHTTNKSKVVNFNNGAYECKQSYDLNISVDRIKFLELIGFIQPYKNEKIAPNKQSAYAVSKPKSSYEIVNVEYLGDEEVWDITVDNNSHTYWSDGCDVHNCGEIVLKPFQFCNLSVAIARHNDTLETLAKKVELATIIGTIQSMATKFKGLRNVWRENCEAERLLGVDISGQWDCPLLLGRDSELIFEHLKQVAIRTNQKYSAMLGINQSVSVTCVKPSGNSSLLFDCSSGVHTRYAKYYLRRVRVQKSSPIAKWLADSGFELEQDVAQIDTCIATFPVEAPHSPHYKDDLTAEVQLEHWLKNKLYWTEHNPSVTITYAPNELDFIAEWLYKNQEYIGGLSFLPKSDAVYQQAPYEAIDKETYEQWVAKTPQLDTSKLVELIDETSVAQELACFAGGCDI